jgi:hypothetical protein
MDTAFEHFLHELPEDYGDRASELKALSRVRKSKSPAQ